MLRDIVGGARAVGLHASELCIVHALAGLGGSLEVESQPGVGTTVRIRLPRVEPAMAADVAVSEGSSSASAAARLPLAAAGGEGAATPSASVVAHP